MKKVSIIVPVYNVEQYIKKCLDSLVNQTYKNLEIICVNDGSTDQSGVICDDYASKDTRFKVFHKENGGNSSAMNIGLDALTGDYVGFVDPDDWVELNYFEDMVQLLEASGSEFVCSSFYRDYDDKSIQMKNILPVEDDIIDREQILHYVFVRDKYPAFCAYYWNKLFNASIITGNESQPPLRFREDIKICGDVLFFVEYTLRTKSAKYTTNAYYHYFQRATSLEHAKDLVQRRSCLVAYLSVIDLLAANHLDEDILIWVKRFFVYHATVLLEMAIEQEDEKTIVEMQREIRRFYSEYVVTNLEYQERLERLEYLLNYVPNKEPQFS